ncbi:MAG: sugar transferase [bacterium]
MLPHRFRPIHRLALFVNDLAGVNAAFLLSYSLWMTFRAGAPALTPMYVLLWVFVNALWLPLFYLLGMYRECEARNFFQEARLAAGAVSLGVLLLTFAMFFIRFSPTPEVFYSRAVIVIMWALSVVFIVAGRGVIQYATARLKASGRLRVNTVLVGGAGECARFMTRLLQSAQRDLNVVGCVVPGDQSVNPAPGLKEIGKFGEFGSVIRQRQIELAIVTDPSLRPAQIMRFVNDCREIGIELRILQDHLGVLKSHTSLSEIADVPTVTIRDTPIRGFNRVLKRAMDVAASLALLALLFPLLAAAALAVRLDSPGPVLFRQVRVGRKGRRFHIFKFRTMRADAEELKGALEPGGKKDGRLFKMERDPRSTRVGKTLRRWSLDELPQLINVLFGEVSLVGPRPLIPGEAEGCEEWHLKRLEVTPGVTGLWQVSGRSDLDFDEMVKLDIYYIENWSLWLDFEIIVRTIPAILSRRGAY